jgi:hypothetical protein
MYMYLEYMDMDMDDLYLDIHAIWSIIIVN